MLAMVESIFSVQIELSMLAILETIELYGLKIMLATNYWFKNHGYK